jgi:hypothetical protein
MWRVEGLGTLNGGGWGVFIAPTTILAVGCSFLSTGTPDSPVRTWHPAIHCPVLATSADRWGLEKLTIEFVCPCGAPNSPVRPDVADCFWRFWLWWQSTVGEVNRCSWAHWTVQWHTGQSDEFRWGAMRFPESGMFVGCASLGTRHCPVHTGQSGALQAGASLTCPIFREVAQWSIFLVDLYELYALDKRSTRQTS